MDDMGKLSGLVLRKRVFYFRQRVPEPLRKLVADHSDRWRALALHPGSSPRWRQFLEKSGAIRTEVWKSLETSDAAVARGRYHTVASEFFADAEALSERLRGSQVRPANDELVALAQCYFVSIDNESEQSFTALILDDQLEVAQENVIDDIATIGRNGPVDPVVRSSYRSTAIDMLLDARFSEWDEDAIAKLSGYLIRARLVERNRSLERARGNFQNLPSDNLFPPPNLPSAKASITSAQKPVYHPRSDFAVKAANGETLDQSYSRYQSEQANKGRSTKTLAGYNFIGLMVRELWGDRLPSSLETRDASELISLLQSLPANWKKRPDTRQLSIREAASLPKLASRPLLAPLTANGYLGDVSAFFGWCVREELMARNLVSGKSVKAIGDDDDERDPFSLADLRAIFNPDYRNNARFRANDKTPLLPSEMNIDARFWCPIIALFTGMRLNEICQLIKSDIRGIEGVLCICIEAKVPEEHQSNLNGLKRSLKTRSSKRNIPIPQALISLGFLDFVESQDVRLFPDLKADAKGRTAEAVTRWFSRYLDTLAITSKEKVFHSFRHTWRNAATNSRMMRDVMLYVGGWKAGEVSDTYNRRGPMMSLAKEELDKVNFDGLLLDHLRPLNSIEKPEHALAEN